MNPTTKKTLIIVLIIVLALCLCAAAFVLLGGFALYRSWLAPTPGAQSATDAPVITARQRAHATPPHRQRRRYQRLDG